MPAKSVSAPISVSITAPRLRIAEFKIRGTAPLVIHKFSAKARQQIMETQKAGSQSSSKRKKEPKDFDEVFNGARHISEEGWDGFPASAIRSACIDACRLVGFKMTFAKLSIFVIGDGLDADEGTPLIRIEGGEPEKHEGTVRNATGVVDIRMRPMWRQWGAIIKLQYDEDQFSAQDVTNLLMRAGLQVGIGEGRPNSKSSHGQGWGTFEVVSE